MARANKTDLKDDVFYLYIGFHEHDAPELAIPRLPHATGAGGLLAYVRNEKPVDQPLKEGRRCP